MAVVAFCASLIFSSAVFCDQSNEPLKPIAAVAMAMAAAAAVRPKRIVRPKEAYNRLGCGKTKFSEDYEYHEGDDPNVPGTDIPRVKAIPFGPRNKGFLEHEIDALIDALAAKGGTHSSVAAECNAVRRGMIIAAYVAALDGRDPSTVSILDLLPGIHERVPRVSNDEIIGALEWSARQNKREAEALIDAPTRRQAQSKQTPHVAQRR
jgi:hypothetical protein